MFVEVELEQRILDTYPKSDNTRSKRRTTEILAFPSFGSVGGVGSGDVGVVGGVVVGVVGGVVVGGVGGVGLVLVTPCRKHRLYLTRMARIAFRTSSPSR